MQRRRILEKEVAQPVSFEHLIATLEAAYSNAVLLYSKKFKQNEDLVQNLVEKLSSTKAEVMFFSGNEMQDAGVHAVCSALSKDGQIRVLGLDRNNITHTGVHYVAKVLEKKNVAIRGLILSHNEAFCDGARRLANALMGNKALAFLSLKGNGVADPGASALGMMLEANTSLTTLDLSNNKIGDDGAGQIAKGLLQNETLKHLALQNNKIAEGWVNIAGSIQENLRSAIVFINASSNPEMSEDSRSRLQELAQLKTTVVFDNQTKQNIPEWQTLLHEDEPAARSISLHHVMSSSHHILHGHTNNFNAMREKSRDSIQKNTIVEDDASTLDDDAVEDPELWTPLGQLLEGSGLEHWRWELYHKKKLYTIEQAKALVEEDMRGWGMSGAESMKFKVLVRSVPGKRKVRKTIGPK